MKNSNKITNKISISLIAFAMLLACILQSPVQAALPTSGTANGGFYSGLGVDGIKGLMYFKVGSYTAYCLQANKTAPFGGNRGGKFTYVPVSKANWTPNLSQFTPEVRERLNMLIGYGYPITPTADFKKIYKEQTGKTDLDNLTTSEHRASTQLAAWYVTDGPNSYKGSIPARIKTARDFILAKSYVTPELKIDSSQAKQVTSVIYSENTNIIKGPYTVSYTGYLAEGGEGEAKIKLQTLNGATLLTSESDQTGFTEKWVENNTSFYVKIPIDKLTGNIECAKASIWYKLHEEFEWYAANNDVKITYGDTPAGSSSTNKQGISHTSAGHTGGLAIFRRNEMQLLIIPDTSAVPTEKSINLNVDWQAIEKTVDLGLEKWVNTVSNTTGVKTYANHNTNDNNVEGRAGDIYVSEGDIVTYNIRIYNHGNVDATASKITDTIPAGLEFLPDNEINKQYGWKLGSDGKVSTDYLSNTLIGKHQDSGTAHNGLSYNSDATVSKIYCDTCDNKAKDVKIALRVKPSDSTIKRMINIAEIAEYKTEDGVMQKDIDSTAANHPNNHTFQVTGENSEKGSRDNKPYYREDDEDIAVVVPTMLDLGLEKWVNTVSNTTGVKTYANHNTGDNNVEGRVGDIYVAEGDIVTYNIRIYNHGNIDATASQISDTIPEGLEFLPDNETNKQYGWEIGEDGKVYTAYLSNTLIDKHQKVGTAHNGLSYNSDGNVDKVYCDTCDNKAKDVKIALRVKPANSTIKRMINIAEITEYKTQNGVMQNDIDSTAANHPNNHKFQVTGENPEKGSRNNKPYYREDDEDIAVVVPVMLDLGLEKWVSKVSSEIGSKIVNQTYADHNINDNNVEGRTGDIYVCAGDVVTYTIRIYNHGNVDATASQISDTIPEGLEFLPDNETNKKYGWEIGEDGKVSTNYLSDILIGKHQNVGTAHNGLSYDSDKNVDKIYCEVCDNKAKEVKIALLVKPVAPTISRMINIAEITEYKTKDGVVENDIDSSVANHPDDHVFQVDGENSEKGTRQDKSYYREDDEDIAVILPARFDLALEKWVNKVVRENEEDRVYDNRNELDGGIEGRTGDIRVRTGDIVVYTIRLFNQGNIDGYAEIIKDNVPAGLEFLPDNLLNKLYGWEEHEDGNVYTSFLGKDNSEIIKELLSSDKTIKEILEELGLKDIEKQIEELSEVLKNQQGEQSEELKKQIEELSKALKNQGAELSEEYINNFIEAYKDGTLLEKRGYKQLPIIGYNRSQNQGETKEKSDDTCPYTDIQIAFKVGKTVTDDKKAIDKIINLAQIEKHSTILDTDNFKYSDIDSKPGNYEGDFEEGKPREDDEDIAVIMPEVFDLALRKWIVSYQKTVKGNTEEVVTTQDFNTTTEQKNGEKLVKIDIDSSKLKDTQIKIRYGIRIENQGEIPGYAKELTDYLPVGTEFYAEDNMGENGKPNWVLDGTKLVTGEGYEDQLNTILQPGETVMYYLTLRWKSSADNLGIKNNWVEISKDYNDWDVPDKDSDPSNMLEARDPQYWEDDEDEVPFLLTVKTGEISISYIIGIGILLTALGVTIIMKRRIKNNI